MKLFAVIPIMITSLLGGYLAAQTIANGDADAGRKLTGKQRASSTAERETMDGNVADYAKELESIADADPSEMQRRIATVVEKFPADSFRRQRLVEIAQWIEDGKDVAEARLLLKELAADIAFKPKFEADQPEGFPQPTPVGEIEVKSYPAYRMARTNSANNNGFFTLFQHIQSNNIAMTAPVEMSYTSSGNDVKEKTMAFLYAEPTTGKRQQSEKMEVVDVDPLGVISTGVRGKTSNESIAAAIKQLNSRANKLMPNAKFAKDVRVLSYNSPGVPADQRYFEVQLQITNK